MSDVGYHLLLHGGPVLVASRHKGTMPWHRDAKSRSAQSPFNTMYFQRLHMPFVRRMQLTLVMVQLHSRLDSSWNASRSRLVCMHAGLDCFHLSYICRRNPPQKHSVTWAWTLVRRRHCGQCDGALLDTAARFTFVSPPQHPASAIRVSNHAGTRLVPSHLYLSCS